MARITDAIIRAIKQQHALDTLGFKWSILAYEMCPPIRDHVCVCVEGHTGLRTLVVKNIVEGGSFFSWLERLLSLAILDTDGEKISNGTTVDKLYLLNGFFRGNAQLVKESAFLRPLLLATALTGSASRSFQHTALFFFQTMLTCCASLLMVQIWIIW